MCLQALVLDDNNVTDWQCLRPLYSLSSLTCLSLSDNRIARIPVAELSQGTTKLVHVKCLQYFSPVHMMLANLHGAVLMLCALPRARLF